MLRIAVLLLLLPLAACLERSAALTFENPQTGETRQACGPVLGVVGVAELRQVCAQAYRQKGWVGLAQAAQDQGAP